jgi:translation initiation factor 2B subunit (eIF-2B alpha/beta/delta family)
VFGEPSTWQEQIERIVIDKRSGSSEISRRCAKALIAYADQERASGVEQVVYTVSEAASKVVRAHPSMASVVRLLNDAVLATVSAETVRSALDQVRRVSNEYLAWAEQASLLVVESALQLLPREGVILVLSYSAAVAKSLIDAGHRGYKLGVICLESRPMYEGRRLATLLSRSGLDVSLIVDAAALNRLHEADMFIVGVECLTEGGLVSKVGTAMVACAAQSVGVPAYAIGDTSKVWPSQLAGPIMLEHGAGEVWPNAPRPIRVQNQYVDLTPWDRVGGVVTERGTIGRYEVAQIGAAIDVAQRLADIVLSVRGK